MIAPFGVLRASGVGACVVLLACTGERPPAPRPPAPPAPAIVPEAHARPQPKAPCEQARELRAKVPGHLEQGKLDRTVRALRSADQLCPSESAGSWAAHVTALAEIGLWDDARALADRIDATPDAPPDARAAAQAARAKISAVDEPPADPALARESARKLALEAQAAAAKGEHVLAKARWLAAWDAFRPNGEALLGAGLAARALNDPAGAQRLIDRAIVDYERQSGQKLELDVPNGFGGFVHGLAWNQSARLLAVAHRTVVSVIDAVTLRERVRLRGHDQTVTGVDFAPDGRELVTGARDGTVRLWELATGLQRHALEGHGADVTAVAYDRSGGTVASAGADRTIRLWDAKTGAPKGVLEGHAGVVTSLAFSTTGNTLASASDDKSVVVWDLGTKTPKTKLEGHAAALRAVDLASAVATGGDDGVVKLWNPATGAALRTLEGHSGKISAIGFAPGGKRVASASLDTSVKIWDAASGELLRSLEGHPVMAVSLAWTGDGKQLATGAFNTVHVWDGTTYAERARLEGHAEPVTSMSFAPDGNAIVIGSRDRTVRLFGPGGVRTLDTHAGPVTAVAFAPDGATIASAGFDGSIRRQRITGGSSPAIIHGAGSVQSMAWSPDGGTLAVASTNHSVRFFRFGEAAEGGAGPGAYGVTFSPDGRRVIFAAAGKVAIVRDVKTGGDLARLTGHTGSVNAVAWSADGATLATASSDGTVRLWDAKTYEQKMVFQTAEPALSVAFRPGGAGSISVAAGLEGGGVRLFSWMMSAPLMTLSAHGDSVTSVSFSPDGRWLATGSRDGSTRLWSLPDAQLRLSLRAVAGSDAAYAFAPNGEVELFGEARDYPVCRVGPISVAFELCEERFVTPGLLARTLRGEP